MKLGRVLAWACRLAVLGLIGYAGFGAGSSYFHTSEVVDTAFQEAVRRAKLSVGSHIQRVDASFTDDVRTGILRAARRDGIPVDERKLRLTNAANTLRVELRWAYPVLSYDGETVLAVPLSVDRTFEVR